jgi:tRNA-modifying protein YgfZ
MLTLPGQSPSHAGMNMASGRLFQLGLLRVAGSDNIAFLQGQLSNDTQRLRAGETLLAALSTAQGRVLAILQLLPHPSGVILILPRELALPTLQLLRKFVLRSKVTIEDISDSMAIAGHFGTDALRSAGLAIPPAGSYVHSGALGVGRVCGDPNRFWVIGEGAALVQRGLAGNVLHAEVTERAWRHGDIQRGTPQIYAATREQFVAQMLNLDLLDGISFSKGCYTGQEIIARTQHLGRIKRRMFRLRLPRGDWQIGQTLHLAGRAGRLVEVVTLADCSEALAVLGLDGSDAHSGPETVAAVELPLPYAVPQSAPP